MRLRYQMVVVALSLGFFGTIAGAQAGSVQDGANELYKANCSLCHGDDGAGSALGVRFKVLDLRSKEVQDKSAKEMQQTIRGGKGNMPAFGNRLKSDEIDKLVAYVRQIKSKQE